MTIESQKQNVVDADLKWFIEDSLARISYSVERPLLAVQCSGPIFMDGWYIEHCSTGLCPYRKPGQWPFLDIHRRFDCQSEWVTLKREATDPMKWKFLSMISYSGSTAYSEPSYWICSWCRWKPVMDWISWPESTKEEEERSKSTLMKSTLLAARAIFTLVNPHLLMLCWWCWLMATTGRMLEN